MCLQSPSLRPGNHFLVEVVTVFGGGVGDLDLEFDFDLEFAAFGVVPVVVVDEAAVGFAQAED